VAPVSRSVFPPVATALLLVLLGGFVAVRAFGAADDFRPDLNQLDPPLARYPPEPGDPPPRLSRRVVVIIVDGLRLKSSYGVDGLDRLRRAGIDAAARPGFPTYSRPNHVAILTGVPPTWSGVRNNTYDVPVMLDSLMDRANAAGLRSAYAADLAFGAGMMFRDDFEAIHYAPWPGGFAKAARVALEQDYPLVVLLPGSVDAAGHQHGAANREYGGALERVDREIEAALRPLDLARDTVILTADHGHTDEGGHGGTEPEVMEVPLIMAGAGIRAGAALKTADLTDVAPTAATLLGLPPPGHGLGRTLVDALELSPEARAAIERADGERLVRNRSRVEEIRAANGPRLARKRLVRLLGMASMGALVLFLLLVARRAGALHFDWRILVIAVPAFPLTYYALLDILGQRFSLSALPDRDGALDGLLQFGFISTGVQVLASWIALRGRVVLRDRLAAANALTATGMAIGWLASGLLWALLATGAAAEPPGSAVTLLVPATYIATACHAVAVAVTLGLEIVVFFARAVDPRDRQRR
jgi:hypothetical protein